MSPTSYKENKKKFRDFYTLSTNHPSETLPSTTFSNFRTRRIYTVGVSGYYWIKCHSTPCDNVRSHSKLLHWHLKSSLLTVVDLGRVSTDMALHYDLEISVEKRHPLVLTGPLEPT